MKSLMPDEAHAVWDLLTSLAGATEDDRAAFVAYLTTPQRFMHEYRFVGRLGFGGKLHLHGGHGPYVSCYIEDRDEVRDAIVATVNAKLDEMFAPADRLPGAA